MSPIAINILCVWGGTIAGFLFAAFWIGAHQEDKDENWDV